MIYIVGIGPGHVDYILKKSFLCCLLKLKLHKYTLFGYKIRIIDYKVLIKC